MEDHPVLVLLVSFVHQVFFSRKIPTANSVRQIWNWLTIEFTLEEFYLVSRSGG